MRLNKSLIGVIELRIEDKPKFYFAVENFARELRDYFRDEIIQDYDECFEDREPLDWNDLD